MEKKKKRFYYRRVHPKHCVRKGTEEEMGVCWDWANKLDEKCKECSFHKDNYFGEEVKVEELNSV